MSRTYLLALIAATAPAQSEAIAEPRVLYTHHNGGCYHMTDRAECCQHKDGRNYSEAGHYYHERCFPSAVGKTFTSGRVCEPECWVKGTCGDGSPQTDRIGQCLDLDFDDSILVVSEDTSSRTMTTTALWPIVTTEAETQPSHALSHRDKIIAGAVAGSVGGVALLGGLLGGLITSTEPPEATPPPPALAPSRFLEGAGRASSSAQTISEHLRSPWLAVLALGALVAIVGSSVVKSSRGGARSIPGDSQLEESSDDEGMSLSPRSPRDTFTSAFDIIDTNDDGVMSGGNSNSARRTIFSTAAPVYLLPKSPKRMQK